MNTHSLEIIKHSFTKRGWYVDYHLPSIEYSMEESSELITSLLEKSSPCMISRLGNTELHIISNYISSQKRHSVIKYITGRQDSWWFEESWVNALNTGAGVFPVDKQTLTRFSELYIEDIKQIDILGSWLPQERNLHPYLTPNHKRIRLIDLDPYWSKHPWTRVLQGKRILVIHPFAESIRSQYRKRSLLFDNPDILPTFTSLEVIPAIQSIAGEKTRFSDWFEALDFMKNEINKRIYDICIIGCGAYGLPLAAHVKRLGKKAIHMGGTTQLLFGIMGDRWKNWPASVCDDHKIDYAGLENGFWIRPSKEETPSNAKNVENGCYW